jgi:hypothetical protein
MSILNETLRNGAEGPFRNFTQDVWGISGLHTAFLDRFRHENGRCPRILHIGNIANNAFKNAYILRKFGVECDVLCYDYYHVMACPEWELAEFSTDGFNFNAPVWSKVDLGGFERPRWFAQGRFATCMDYLIALREVSANAESLWRTMALEQDEAGREVQGSSPWAAYDADRVLQEAERLAALFQVTFPERAEKPEAEAIAALYGAYLNETDRLKRLFSHYDLVIGYATDGFFALIAQKTPYACFEHGTIRIFPFDNTIFGQMCALSYANATDVLISNCDNIIAARRLRLRSFRFLPHAMLEDFRHDPSAEVLRDSLLAQHDSDFIIFHPSRQHWSDAEDPNWEKGNDRLIRAFAHLVRSERPRALLIMVAWGQTVDASKSLVEQLGVSSRVVWIKPKPMREVGRYTAAADVLADQFVIGAWGAIMPHGMMLGTPTMLYLNKAIHAWCFPQMPPVLNARTLEEVQVELIAASRRAIEGRPGEEAVLWYDRYHSEAVVVGRLLDSLAACLEPTPGELALSRQRMMHAELFSVALTAARHEKDGHKNNLTEINNILKDGHKNNLTEINNILTEINKLTVIQTTMANSTMSSRLARIVGHLRESRSIPGRMIYQSLRLPWKVINWFARKITRLI